jgi:hypothetical protein
MSKLHRTLFGALAGVAVLFSLLGWLARMNVASAGVEPNAYVSVSELEPDATHPSWENNLNWWIDGNDALGASQPQLSVVEPTATQPSSSGAGPTGSAPVAGSRANGLPAPGADDQPFGESLAFVAGTVLVGASLLGRCSASVSQPTPKRRWLMPGLEDWLVEQLSSRELQRKSEIVYGAASGTAIGDAARR